MSRNQNYERILVSFILVATSMLIFSITRKKTNVLMIIIFHVTTINKLNIVTDILVIHIGIAMCKSLTLLGITVLLTSFRKSLHHA